MTTLEDFKNDWLEKQASIYQPKYDQPTLEQIIKRRVKKHVNTSIQYFWASFALQILVYSMLTHVIVRYWVDPALVSFSVLGIIMYVPFTIVLMRKVKKMAAIKISRNQASVVSAENYVRHQKDILEGFYSFKKWYEFILIPWSSIVGVVLVFSLYVPGGIQEHVMGAVITLVVTLLSCGVAIYKENKKSFEAPIQQLESVLREFKQEG